MKIYDITTAFVPNVTPCKALSSVVNSVVVDVNLNKLELLIVTTRWQQTFNRLPNVHILKKKTLKDIENYIALIKEFKTIQLEHITMYIFCR